MLFRRRASHRATATSPHGFVGGCTPFTLVTSSYRMGPLAGVIGVLGPTRMPYDKIVALVDHTSRLVGELLA